ncbi:mitochondrial carrier domain-containing protein [Polychytrium aggregatum]|uniref:mitochondrial carrier domain-containing protein n=1 Tax=Polychytrium aggregatum TaxID=110093 RepID=UPI0022FE4959|nr:mitochondrial carrier domain-containing protein [Polychytrium aggregatum]KAI9205007.1 mitochondrial carrier domain-containing protein [Polychytrium aggregatum]
MSSDNVTFLGHARGFAMASIAACASATLTNPMEVIKTRLQLQGELSKTSNGGKLYGNAFSALITIGRNEGIRGLQKGLIPAYGYQLFNNGCRIGLYEPIKQFYQQVIGQLWSSNSQHNSLPVMLAAGATSGILGALTASPLFLVKTRMQSYSPELSSVGHQHAYVTQGTLRSLQIIYRNEGLRGLWRGVDAAMFRSGVASAVQLASYDKSKQLLKGTGWFHLGPYGDGNLDLHLAASSITGLLMCIAMNPFDVTMTRMYNQKATGGHGVLYSGTLDCIMKTVRAEGVAALYKGFTAHYMRIGPHIVFTFVFLEQLKKLSRMWDQSQLQVAALTK